MLRVALHGAPPGGAWRGEGGGPIGWTRLRSTDSMNEAPTSRKPGGCALESGGGGGSGPHGPIARSLLTKAAHCARPPPSARSVQQTVNSWRSVTAVAWCKPAGDTGARWRRRQRKWVADAADRARSQPGGGRAEAATGSARAPQGCASRWWTCGERVAVGRQGGGRWRGAEGALRAMHCSTASSCSAPRRSARAASPYSSRGRADGQWHPPPQPARVTFGAQARSSWPDPAAAAAAPPPAATRLAAAASAPSSTGRHRSCPARASGARSATPPWRSAAGPGRGT